MSTSSKAGKASGRKRASQAKSRRLSVLAAFARLKPTYRMHPYADGALDALEEELRNDRTRVLPKDEEWGVVRSWTVRSASDLHRPPLPKNVVPPDILEKWQALLIERIDELREEAARRVRTKRGPRREAPSRETIRKDLKALGIRSKRQKKTFG